MERGLLWLPLLGMFMALAWAGRHEYLKVQAYEAWAVDFDRSKYDIRSMLGQRGHDLTWGRPTRQGPVDLITLSLQGVTALQLEVDGQPVPEDKPSPTGKSINLVLSTDRDETYQIPFTDSDLARRWEKALHQSLQTLKSASA